MNSLIIFLLHYNLQHLPFDFYYHLMGVATDLSLPPTKSHLKSNVKYSANIYRLSLYRSWDIPSQLHSS